MKEDIGQLSEQQKNYEYKKMMHTLSSGKPLIRRGVFNRIFEILGVYSSKMQAKPIKDSKYDRYVELGYMHIGSIFNEEFKAAFDRYLVDYKVVPCRTLDQKQQPTNYGHISVYFKWDQVQWGLMDEDLKKKYPKAFKVDKRGCVSLDTYKVRKERIRFKNIRSFAVNKDIPLIRWDDIKSNNISLTSYTEVAIDPDNELFVEIEELRLKFQGLKRCDFNGMGLKLVNSFYSDYKKYHRFEIKDLALWKASKLQYNLTTD